MNHAKDGKTFAAALDANNALEKRILSELEDFTRRDVEELPFKD